MRRLPTALLVTVCAALAAAGCTGDAQSESAVVTRTDGSDPSVSISGDSADELGTSLVRVINATPNVGEVYVRTDDRVVASSVPYQSVSEYARIPETLAEFEVSAAPGNVWRRLDVNTELLVDGHRYTLIVLRGDDALDFKTRVVQDEVPISESNAIVRVLRVNDGLENISVRLGWSDAGRFSELESGGQSDYEEIDPTLTNLSIHTEDGSLLATVPSVSFRAGSSYTIVLSRGADDTVQFFWIEDQLIT